MSDIELIDLLATNAMGWKIHKTSAHRPGDRDLPHAWRWRRGDQNDLMIYDGKKNRRWDPLAIGDDAAELAAKLEGRGMTLATNDEAGRRAFCLAAADCL